MNAVLCALSDKRRLLLEDSPELLHDVLAARTRERIPGLLDLGKTWHALDVITSDEGEDAVLGDAILGRSGRAFGPELSFGRGKLLAPARVGEISKALAALGDDPVRERYETLRGRGVHGGYGPKSGLVTMEAEYDRELAALGIADDDEEEVEKLELAQRLEAVVTFYRDAAARGDSVLVVVV